MALNEDYLTVSNFQVRIEGHNWSTFDSVTGLGIDIEDIPDNGQENQITSRPGRFKARDITLTRRFKNDKELYDWIAKLKSGTKQRKSGSVVLTDDDGKKVLSFDFEHAYPKHWSGPDLAKDPRGNDILKERIVLSVADLQMKA